MYLAINLRATRVSPATRSALDGKTSVGLIMNSEGNVHALVDGITLQYFRLTQDIEDTEKREPCYAIGGNVKMV